MLFFLGRLLVGVLLYYMYVQCRGTQWGENGFIRIQRQEHSQASVPLPLLGHLFSFSTHTGVCGMALSASLPLGGFLLSSSTTSSVAAPDIGVGGSETLVATLVDWFQSNAAVGRR